MCAIRVARAGFAAVRVFPVGGTLSTISVPRFRPRRAARSVFANDQLGRRGMPAGSFR
ncbi:hypothetical protein FTUN_7224 [Frigoriglobus tundricola]|uniref:Uncharacterized protein n=1 Tax=Frigoriglobus tundricola TaxID=2774151 RepID=A0A6M5Z1Z2_9BACT|nr:hypothetical protein FTUN_7224 [Frigoriglobus tundricola]